MTTASRRVASTDETGRGFPNRLKGLVAAALVGRLHSTATNLAIGLAVQAWTGSYALSGLVIGGLALGNGLAAPLRGRAVDRSAVATVLKCGAAYAVALMVLGAMTATVGRDWWPLAVALALAAGTLLPPVAPAFRAALPILTPNGAQVTRVLTWEATYQELIFILGPPATMLVVALASESGALMVVGGLAGVGSLTFALVLRRARAWPQRAELPEATSAAAPSAAAKNGLGARGALLRLALAYGLLLAALTAMTLVGVTVSVDAGRSAAAGWLEAAIACGSMSGGLLASRVAIGRWPLSGRMAAMAVALGLLAAVTALSDSLVLVACALAAAGLWIAPSLALHGAAVLTAAAPGRRAEAFGWVNAMGMGINAAITPLVGVVLDGAGATGGSVLAMAGLILASASVLGIQAPADSDE